MAEQFDRQVTITIGVGDAILAISDNKIEFELETSRAGFPNEAKIGIYNLSRTTRQRIKDAGEFIQLEAGYPQNKGIIFKGNLAKVWHERVSKTDIVTRIEAADGLSDFQNAMINTTLPAGQNSPKDIVQACAAQFEVVGVGSLNILDGLPGTDRATVLCGNVKDELDKVGRKHDFSWSIQNNELELVKNGEAIEDVTIVSKETGMIGAPTVTESGVDVKVLLNPKLRVNRIIQVISDFIDDADTLNFNKRDTDLGGGFYRMDKIKYAGTNRADGEFTCTIEGRRVSNGRVV